MKILSKLCLTLVIIPIVIGDAFYAQNNFYYERGKKIYLETSNEFIAIKMKAGVEKSVIDFFISDNQDLDGLSAVINNENIYKYKIKNSDDINGIIDRLRKNEFVEYVNPVYIKDGFELIPYDNFVVQFKKEVSPTDIETLNKKFNVEIVRKSEFVDNLYTFRITNKTTKSILEIANIYYENLPCEWSEPDFFQEFQSYYSPNDTYYRYQYYLPQINVQKAWDIAKGNSSITVAVIDEGGAPNEDIPPSRIAPGHNFYPPESSDPTPGGNQAHGMACGGIIAATQDNNAGISGIAPNSKLMFLKISDAWGKFTTPDIEAQAFDFARVNNADVISCSWGGGTPTAILSDAINRAITQGRYGKGCIVVFAAGNNASSISYPGNLPGIITVGAIDRNNNHWSYSNTGPELELVAPSGTTATREKIICEVVSSAY